MGYTGIQINGDIDKYWFYSNSDKGVGTFVPVSDGIDTHNKYKCSIVLTMLKWKKILILNGICTNIKILKFEYKSWIICMS